MAGVFTKRSNLLIVSLYKVERLAEDTAEVGVRNLRENEHGFFLWSLEDRQAFFPVKKWWMPGYEHSEVASSDKNKK